MGKITAFLSFVIAVASCQVFARSTRLFSDKQATAEEQTLSNSQAVVAPVATVVQPTPPAEDLSRPATFFGAVYSTTTLQAATTISDVRRAHRTLQKQVETQKDKALSLYDESNKNDVSPAKTSTAPSKLFKQYAAAVDDNNTAKATLATASAAYQKDRATYVNGAGKTTNFLEAERASQSDTSQRVVFEAALKKASLHDEWSAMNKAVTALNAATKDMATKWRALSPSLQALWQAYDMQRKSIDSAAAVREGVLRGTSA